MSGCIDQNIGNLLYAYELGLLSDEERAEVERHLLECDDCYRRLTEFKDAATLLRHDPMVRDQIAQLDQEALDQLSDEQSPAPEKRPWKSIIRTMVAVAAVLLILVLKPWKIEISPTHEAEAYQNRLAILDFQNLAAPNDPGRFGEIAAVLLITDLSESRYTHVVSQQHIYDILQSLHHELSLPVKPEVASQVARRAQAQWMLTGAILQTEPELIIAAELADVNSGEVVAAHRITAGSEETIFSVIDSLTVLIKNDLSLPAAAGRESDPSVADVTTHSPEALRHYIDGLRYIPRFYLGEARQAFDSAIYYDSTFAMAYYYGYTMSTTRREGEYYISHAMKYLDKANRQGQYYITSARALLDRRFNDADAILEQAAEEYPDDKNVHLRLGMMLYTLGRFEESMRHLQQAIALDSSFKQAYNQLIYSAERAGKYEVAILTADKYAEIAPDEPNPYDSRGDLFARNGKVAEAIESYRMALKKRPTFYASLENLGLMYLFSRQFEKSDSCFRAMPEAAGMFRVYYSIVFRAAAHLYQGQFDEALALLGAGPDSLATDSTFRNFGANRLMRATIYREQGNRAAVVEEMAACRSIFLAAPGSDSLVYMDFYIQALAENSQLDTVRHLVQFTREYYMRTGIGKGALNYALGSISFVEGKYDSAVSYFGESSVQLSDFASCMMLGQSYLKAKRLDRAVEKFNEIVSRFTRDRAFYAIWDVEIHYYLGLAYEESGWFDKATEQYEIFLSYWEDADARLETVADARQRLTHLKSGAS